MWSTYETAVSRYTTIQRFLDMLSISDNRPNRLCSEIDLKVSGHVGPLDMGA